MPFWFKVNYLFVGFMFGDRFGCNMHSGGKRDAVAIALNVDNFFWSTINLFTRLFTSFQQLTTSFT